MLRSGLNSVAAGLCFRVLAIHFLASFSFFFFLCGGHVVCDRLEMINDWSSRWSDEVWQSFLCSARNHQLQIRITSCNFHLDSL